MCHIISIQDSTSDVSPQPSPNLNLPMPLFSDDKENDTFSWDISPIKWLHTESDVDDEQPSKHFATSTQVLPQNNQQEQNNSQASQSLVINQQYNFSYI